MPESSHRPAALLVLEDGWALRGRSYGAQGRTIGEIVFSTGMTGYQETLTDPSYHRQVVVQTAPHIGNTGVNDEDAESDRIWVAGYVVREPARRASSWRARRQLEDDLRSAGVVGLCEVDTRALTRHLREAGAMRGGIFSGDSLPAGATGPGGPSQACIDICLEAVRSEPPMTGRALAAEVTTPSGYVGLLTPYQGQISIDGLTLQTNQADYRKKIGFIPETPSLYEELTLREHLETVAMAYDIELDLAMGRAEKLLGIFRLADKLDWFPINFSKGMKQKVMIICAFMIDPSLFIIDEPFLGLDPLAITDLTNLLSEEKSKGKSILMSTHVLDSAEKMCDRFVILHRGEIRAIGTLAELQAEFGNSQASLNDIYMTLTSEV